MPSHPWRGRLLQRLLTAVLRRPGWVILLFASVTLFFAWQLRNLTFRTSIYDLAVEDLPASAYYERFKKAFGSEEVILVVVRSDGVFEPATFEALTRLSDSLAELPGVRRVLSLPGVKRDIDITNRWSLPEFARLLEPVDLFERNFISEDGRTTIVSLVLEAEADKDRVVDEVERIIEAQPVGSRTYAIGMPLVARALVTYTEADFLLLPPVTFLVILIVLFAIFGDLRGMLAPSGSVIVALIWTLGLMAATGTALSLMTMIVPVFLIAVGTAYCMHVVAEYRASARGADLPREAVFRCFSRVGFPASLAVVTTVVGLASLLVNRIEGTREFALFACFGMLSLLAVMLLLLPAVLCKVPLPRQHRDGPVPRLVNRLLERVVALNLLRQRTVLPVLAGVTLLAALGIFRIRVETNPVDYFKRSTEISRNFHDVFRDMAGSFPVNVVLDGKVDGTFEQPENLERMAAVQRFLETLDGVDKSIAFSDFLKLVRYASNRFDPGFYALPEADYEIRMLTNTYKSMLGQDMYARFVDPEMSRANIMLRTHIASSRDFFELRERVNAYLEEHYGDVFDFRVTGLGMVIAESSHVLVASQVKSLSLTVLIIFGIMLLLFLSGKVGAVAMATNCFPIVIAFGFMGWAGIKLSMVTSLIASIAIGLAVDDTIHYLVRYNREFRKDLDKDRALKATIRGVGPPIVFTTLTMSLGFSVLLFSHFEPTAVFGLLMVITMVSALVGDLVLLPAVMRHVELVTAWDVMSLIPTLGGISPANAHELKQPLNAVKLGVEYLRTMLDRGEKIPEEDLDEVVREIGAEVDRATTYIDRLQEFGRRVEGGLERLCINEPIRDTLDVVGKQLELENIRVEQDLDEEVPPILGHRSRLDQALYNLLCNAQEAISRKGGRSGADRVIRVRSRAEAGNVIVAVEDAGVGIEPEIRDRVLEPFFTTKEEGQGLGLGLSITREIVRDYRGRIGFSSVPGEGSTFWISFPAEGPTRG